VFVQGIFVQELRCELAARGIVACSWGERYDIPDHDQRAGLDRLAKVLDGEQAR
jgi:hypothetical protein